MNVRCFVRFMFSSNCQPTDQLAPFTPTCQQLFPNKRLWRWHVGSLKRNFIPSACSFLIWIKVNENGLYVVAYVMLVMAQRLSGFNFSLILAKTNKQQQQRPVLKKSQSFLKSVSNLSQSKIQKQIRSLSHYHVNHLRPRNNLSVFPFKGISYIRAFGVEHFM